MAQVQISSDSMAVLTGANAEYIAQLYGQFLSNPSEVDGSWQEFFTALNDNEKTLLDELTGASWTPKENKRKIGGFGEPSPGEVAEKAPAKTGAVSDADIQQAAKDSIGALMLIRAFRARGHLESNLDPLGLREKTDHPELDPSHYGFKTEDYSRPIYIGGVLGMEQASINEILPALRQTYSGNIGVEFMHLTDPEEKSLIQERIEAPRNKTDFSVEGKKAILERLTAAEGFEQFLHKKYPCVR